MRIKSGTIKLNVLYEECLFLLKNSVYEKYYLKSTLHKKVNSDFTDSILKKHFTFYVRKNMLDDSKNIEDNFAFYAKKIFATDDIFRLLFLKNLSEIDKERYEINWIIVESDKDINQSLINQELLFLDYFIKKEKTNTKGQIDYELFEEILLKENENIKKDFLKTARKNFLQNIFGLKLNKTNYATKKLIYYENANKIEIKKNMINYCYTFNCPLCGFPHKIFLNGHANANINKYIYLNEKNNRFIFKCNHYKSEISKKINIGFKSTKLDYKLDDNIKEYDKNKAFIYIFRTFRFKDNSQFEYIKNENEIIDFEISKYIKNLRC